MVQQNIAFSPHVLIVPVGATVKFPNKDKVRHHVYSFSKAAKFEIKLFGQDESRSYTFTSPGAVALGCNIHDWMEAYVLVVNTPYFAKASLQGRARVANVPAGRYRLRFWHPRQKTEPASREIEIGSKPLKLEQVIDVAARVFKPRQPTDADLY